MIKAIPLVAAQSASDSSSAFPLLDGRACRWVRDLELRGQDLNYLLHPDFAAGYRNGYKVYGEFPIFTVEEVILEIECSLSHEHHARFPLSFCYSYAWMVGSLFGYLTALLQVDTSLSFRFLLAPVADMHSCLASRGLRQA